MHPRRRVIGCRSPRTQPSPGTARNGGGWRAPASREGARRRMRHGPLPALPPAPNPPNICRPPLRCARYEESCRTRRRMFLPGCFVHLGRPSGRIAPFRRRRPYRRGGVAYRCKQTYYDRVPSQRTAWNPSPGRPSDAPGPGIPRAGRTAAISRGAHGHSLCPCSAPNPQQRCSEQSRRKAVTQSYGTTARVIALATSAGPPACDLRFVRTSIAGGFLRSESPLRVRSEEIGK